MANTYDVLTELTAWCKAQPGGAVQWTLMMVSDVHMYADGERRRDGLQLLIVDHEPPDRSLQDALVWSCNSSDLADLAERTGAWLRQHSER